MVFGWGKKKQERPVFVRRRREETEEERVAAEERPRIREITLNSIPAIIAEVEELRKTQTVSDVNALRNDTNPLIDDLIKIGNHLERDDLDVDDIDRHLAIIVVRGKKQVIDVIKKGVIPLPKISTLEDAKRLDQLLGQILRKVGDTLGRQTRVIHIFAKKYAGQLKENLEIMQKNHREINRLLQNFESTEILAKEIRDAISQINTMKDTHKEKSQKITDTTTETSTIKGDISTIQKSIDGIYASDRYKRYQELKESIIQYGKQKTVLREKINYQFTKISRPLSRYQYGSALEKEQKQLLAKLTAEPFDAMTLQDRDIIITILENIHKGVKSGSISVKDVDKTNLQITETKDSIDGFVRLVSEYHKRYSELQGQLDALRPVDLDSLKKEISRAVSLQEQTALKAKVLQEEIAEIDSSIPKLVSQIEDKTREISNVRYHIAVD